MGVSRNLKKLIIEETTIYIKQLTGESPLVVDELCAFSSSSTIASGTLSPAYQEYN